MAERSTNLALMRRPAYLLCIASFFCWGLNIVGSARADERPETIAVEGATLIDGTGGPAVSCSVILIEGDRIRAVGKCGAVSIPKGAYVVDAAGKFILPGLIDSHCHLEDVGLGDLGELPEEWARSDKLRELVLDDARLDLAAGFYDHRGCRFHSVGVRSTKGN